MKRFLLGVFIGVVLIVLFAYFGGAEVLKAIGREAIRLGEEVEVYEKQLKEMVKRIMELWQRGG